MAAGMGSRYGGLKQLDKVGPNGETIIDYSLHDAIKAGFTKVIFIIRRDFEDQFKLQITNKYLVKFAVEFAFQDIGDLPNGFSCPNGREKPWGTGQAILSARNLINEPFVVINGDDYYGQESFKVIADYYYNGGAQFSMVAFRLDKTLSDFGPVTRGVCNVENDKLDTVVETENLEKKGNYISTNRNITLDGSEPVSMNMWGFTPSLFNYLHEDFVNFLNDEGNELKSEFLIPTVINNLVQDNQEEVYVLRSNASWFGVTYKEDKPFVINKIQELINSGIYTSPLL
jgi:dTDP-glucose pyrophosphorylase